jgi:hypothetical protein
MTIIIYAALNLLRDYIGKDIKTYLMVKKWLCIRIPIIIVQNCTTIFYNIIVLSWKPTKKFP